MELTKEEMEFIFQVLCSHIEENEDYSDIAVNAHAGLALEILKPTLH